MSGSNKSPHIVVVDDDLDMQTVIQAFFMDKGYEISTFTDAESALEECQRSGDTWDVLLSDLNLPNMSGAIFTEKIKKIKPDLPIILITVSKSAKTAVDVIRKGAYDFIVKPIYFPQLLISVERALHLKTLNVNLSQLRERVKSNFTGANGIVGRSRNFISVLEVAKRVAKSNAHIFISGESGTGKEVFARYIHNESSRAKGPFVAINCSAIPETLLESELFGHARGAFTGAYEKKVGLFEESQNGTLFLDEIGDLSLSLQAKLLRVLQEKKIKRVGENQYRPINARIISATHKNLQEEIKGGRFRDDLFYRLSVIPLRIPPLRERVDDILPLAESFLKRFAMENGSLARSFSKDAIKYLLEHGWPGNVRELENAVERAVVLATEAEVKLSDFTSISMEGGQLDAPILTEGNPNGRASTAEYVATTGSNGKPNRFVMPFEGSLPSLDKIVEKYIEFAVTFNEGAKDRTAKEIGIDRKTLYRRLRQDKAGVSETIQ
jgi:DNA-binding NtrC family response regulator